MSTKFEDINAQTPDSSDSLDRPVKDCPLKNQSPVKIEIAEHPKRIERDAESSPYLISASNEAPPDGTFKWSVAGDAFTIAGSDEEKSVALLPVKNSLATLTVKYTQADKSSEAFCELEALVPQVVVSLDKLDFKESQIGKTPDLSVRIKNEGDGRLFFKPTVDEGSDFSIQNSGQVKLELKRGQETTVRIQFKASAEGERTANLVIASNDPETPEKLVSLVGIGTAPKVAVDPPSENFKVRDVNRDYGRDLEKGSFVREFTIRNSGTGVLEINDVAIPTSPDFKVESGVKNKRLTSGQSSTFEVAFRPKTDGVKKATGIVKSNAGEPYPFELEATARQLLRRIKVLCPTAFSKEVEDCKLSLKGTENHSFNQTDWSGVAKLPDDAPGLEPASYEIVFEGSALNKYSILPGDDVSVNQGVATLTAKNPSGEFVVVNVARQARPRFEVLDSNGSRKGFKLTLANGTDSRVMEDTSKEGKVALPSDKKGLTPGLEYTVTLEINGIVYKTDTPTAKYGEGFDKLAKIVMMERPRIKVQWLQGALEGVAVKLHKGNAVWNFGNTTREGIATLPVTEPDLEDGTYRIALGTDAERFTGAAEPATLPLRADFSGMQTVSPVERARPQIEVLWKHNGKALPGVKVELGGEKTDTFSNTTNGDGLTQWGGDLPLKEAERPCRFTINGVGKFQVFDQNDQLLAEPTIKIPESGKPKFTFKILELKWMKVGVNRQLPSNKTKKIENAAIAIQWPGEENEKSFDTKAVEEDAIAEIQDIPALSGKETKCEIRSIKIPKEESSNGEVFEFVKITTT